MNVTIFRHPSLNIYLNVNICCTLLQIAVSSDFFIQHFLIINEINDPEVFCSTNLEENELILP